MDWLTDTPFSCKQERGFLLRIGGLAGFYADPSKTPSCRRAFRENGLIFHNVLVTRALFCRSFIRTGGSAFRII